MPWSGYPETMVTHITFTEWVFSLRAHREVQIGYSIRVNDAWELFGNGRWVWFTERSPAIPASSRSSPSGLSGNLGPRTGSGTGCTGRIPRMSTSRAALPPPVAAVEGQ